MIPLTVVNDEQWVLVCAADAIDEEDVMRFDHQGQSYAIYRSPDDRYFATAGLCTHEAVHLADGLVIDHVIECPKHNGRFDYRDGRALGAPVCVNLKTYPVRLDGGQVWLNLAG
ncbi:MocE family 2Fe-2S type ferredoxin [Pseudomonas sp. NPDC007930]|uniref:MocE family 2Fe-2S type ferredoxin n=1 Tax=Pseudomonas sp. NPDC007930 TaxID=3364417 RepID=UPI0036E56580